MSYKQLSKKEKIIFIWIRHLRFEFIDNNHWNGYIKVINELINPMEIMFRENKYEDIIELCHIATDTIKSLNGNHFHMNLFIELENLLKEVDFN